MSGCNENPQPPDMTVQSETRITQTHYISHERNSLFFYFLFLKHLFVITCAALWKVRSYIVYYTRRFVTSADNRRMERSSINPTLTNVARQKKYKAVWTRFHCVAQLAPNTRGPCSFSSVPESCTAGHESPFCAESSSGSITERWDGCQVTGENEIVLQKFWDLLRHMV